MNTKIIIGAAILAMLLLGGIFTSPGSVVYQKNADTLITTGTMNTGTPKDLYLSPDQMTDIPVDGSRFANASGYLRVEITPNTKYCTYTLYKETGFISNSLWETYYASSLINDLKYDVKVTQPGGAITTRTGLNPNDLSNIKIQLQANPAAPTKEVYLQINGQNANLGQTSCDDRTDFVILRFGGNTYAMKSDEYKIRLNTLVSYSYGIPTSLNMGAVYDMFNALSNPSSLLRYDKALDLTAVSQLQAKYQEPQLGNAQVQISAPFWAYKTIIYEKTPEGRASGASCTIQKAEAGQNTYATLKYTNIGDSSVFFYVPTAGDYQVSGVSQSSGSVASGSSVTEYLPVSAITPKNPATFNIQIKGQSGIATDVACTGEIVASGSGIQPPINPQTQQNQSNQTCLPFVQKTAMTAVGGVNVFGLNLGGTQVSSCVWDFTSLGIIILIAAAALFKMGKGEEAKAVAIAGFALIVLSLVADNALLLALGGGGLFLIALVVVAAYIAVKFLL